MVVDKKIKRADIIRSTEKKFWSKIKFDTLDKCWEWQGGLNSSGYGSFRITDGVGIGVGGSHRYLYQKVFNKRLIHDVFVLHKCDNRKCCNPNHLFEGSQLDNARDMFAKNRRPSVCGVKHHNAKLKPKNIRMIRKLFEIGLPDKRIGYAFGVSEKTILSIKKGQTWKQIV